MGFIKKRFQSVSTFMNWLFRVVWCSYNKFVLWNTFKTLVLGTLPSLRLDLPSHQHLKNKHEVISGKSISNIWLIVIFHINSQNEMKIFISNIKFLYFLDCLNSYCNGICIPSFCCRLWILLSGLPILLWQTWDFYYF